MLAIIIWFMYVEPIYSRDSFPLEAAPQRIIRSIAKKDLNYQLTLLLAAFGYAMV